MAQLSISLTDADLQAISEMVADRLATKLLPSLLVSRADASDTDDSNPRPPRLHYTEAEAAEMLGISLPLLKRWRLAGFARSHTTERPILYRRENLEEISRWMAEGGIEAGKRKNRPRLFASRFSKSA